MRTSTCGYTRSASSLRFSSPTPSGSHRRGTGGAVLAVLPRAPRGRDRRYRDAVVVGLREPRHRVSAARVISRVRVTRRAFPACQRAQNPPPSAGSAGPKSHCGIEQGQPVLTEEGRGVVADPSRRHRRARSTTRYPTRNGSRWPSGGRRRRGWSRPAEPTRPRSSRSPGHGATRAYRPAGSSSETFSDARSSGSHPRVIRTVSWMTSSSRSRGSFGAGSGSGGDRAARGAQPRAARAGWGSTGRRSCGRSPTRAPRRRRWGSRPLPSRVRAASTSAARVRAFSLRRPDRSYGTSIPIMVLLSHREGLEDHGADPAVTDPDLYRVIFENDRVRILESATSTRQHAHTHPTP